MLSLFVPFLAVKKDITDFTISFEKLFHKANFIIAIICKDNLFGEQKLDVRATKFPIYGILCDQGTKLLKFTYKPVLVSFWNNDIPPCYISKPRKCGVSSTKTATVDRKLLSNYSAAMNVINIFMFYNKQSIIDIMKIKLN